MSRLFKILSYSLLVVVVLLVIFIAWVRWGLQSRIPQIADRSAEQWQRETLSKDFYRVNKSWLRHDESGLWEEYLEGDAFERGVAESKLCKEIQFTQEEAFAEQLGTMIPNKNYLHILGYLARIFNRNLQDNITDEYLQEIYGESLFAPHDFDYISAPYDRLLNYHAAHDLGHAFQRLALVGCTSFAAWGPKTTDSLMLMGRNFDFYAGDKFARNKIVLFCKPTTGRKFMMITWPSFIGCTSGMNDAGLAITINSAETDVPGASATPVSLLAREILQYATTIDEAYAIAKKRRIFVSESLLIGSARDHRAIAIEKSPARIAIYDPGTTTLLSTNHYLSDTFRDDIANRRAMTTTSSGYRYDHLHELIDQQPIIDYRYCATILRDQRGIGGKDIGMCNEKAVNQLIAHHSIIFQPERHRFWISTTAFMLGEYMSYDLDSVFARAGQYTGERRLSDAAFTIPADTFLTTRAWRDFQQYKKGESDIIRDISTTPGPHQPLVAWERLTTYNPEYWYPYYLVGQYYKSRHQDDRALTYYRQSLTKEINDSSDVYEIKAIIKKMEAKAQ